MSAQAKMMNISCGLSVGQNGFHVLVLNTTSSVFSLAMELNEKERVMGKNILCAGMKLSLQLSTAGPWAWDHNSHTWEMMR